MNNDEKKVDDLSETYLGTCIWMARGIGFLSWEKNGVQQKDMFVHYSDVDMPGFKAIFKDQKVSFQIGVNHRGLPKAINVRVIK